MTYWKNRQEDGHIQRSHCTNDGQAKEDLEHLFARLPLWLFDIRSTRLCSFTALEAFVDLCWTILRHCADSNRRLRAEKQPRQPNGLER